jgi:hypothetical protein
VNTPPAYDFGAASQGIRARGTCRSVKEDKQVERKQILECTKQASCHAMINGAAAHACSEKKNRTESEEGHRTKEMVNSMHAAHGVWRRTSSEKK